MLSIPINRIQFKKHHPVKLPPRLAINKPLSFRNINMHQQLWGFVWNKHIQKLALADAVQAQRPAEVLLQQFVHQFYQHHTRRYRLAWKMHGINRMTGV